MIMVSNPGAGLPNDPRRFFGLVGFVIADQHDAAGFGHSQHVVPQFRVGGSRVGRHDRVQVAPPHRRQIATGEARVVGQMGDPGSETIGDGGLFGLEQVERLHRRSVALEHTSVDPATKVASRPNANPPIQKNGELQNSLSFGR